MITAVRSVQVLQNCVVDLVRDEGQSVNGKWQEKETVYKEKMPAHKNPAKPKEITWLENGGERLEFIYKFRLMSAPGETPRFILNDGKRYKVIKWDERPSRQFWKYLAEEQFQ